MNACKSYLDIAKDEKKSIYLLYQETIYKLIKTLLRMCQIKNKNISEYTDALSYLKNWFGSSDRRTGKRQLAAKHLRCHPTHITQVLSGTSHLSLEHAIELNSFLGHDSDDSEFFLLLVQMQNAGTSKLRQYFQKKITELKKQRGRISSQVHTAPEFDLKDASEAYYTAWYYNAIHMSTLLDKFSTSARIAAGLRLPLQLVHSVIIELEKLHIVTQLPNGSIRANIENLHLPPSNKNIIRHHASWRARATRAIEESLESGLHYSGVASMSLKDGEIFQAEVLSLIKTLSTLTEKSKSEQLYNFNVDFYCLT